MYRQHTVNLEANFNTKNKELIFSYTISGTNLYAECWRQSILSRRSLYLESCRQIIWWWFLYSAYRTILPFLSSTTTLPTTDIITVIIVPKCDVKNMRTLQLSADKEVSYTVARLFFCYLSIHVLTILILVTSSLSSYSDPKHLRTTRLGIEERNVWYYFHVV